MPMTLEGSCHCGGVKFSVLSQTPVPYQLCACSICRKVGGYSGSVNLGGLTESLNIIMGKDLIKIYTPKGKNSQRNFCSQCSTMLWLWDSGWPELVHPFASAIDSELPTPPDMEMVCVMAGSKPDWVRLPEGKKKVCERYNESGESIEMWHKGRGLYVE